MKTADEIFEEMKAVFFEKTGMEVRSDCDMGVRMAAFAHQAESVYIYNDWVMRQCFPQTAEGQYLDMHCAMRGLSRKEAVKAKGELSFSISTVRQSDVEVPAGTVCMTSGGEAYATSEDGKIAAGEKTCTVAAEACSAGRTGNVAAGAVCFMTAAPLGVERCTNLLPFKGGEDAESDGELRERVLQSYRSLPNGANAAWYEKTVSDIKGVAEVSVIPRSRGTGTVDIIISGDSGLPSEELIADVEKKLEETREICVDIQVKAPSPLLMNMSIKVKAMSGYDPETVKNGVKTAVEGMFGGRMLGKDLLRADICDVIYHVPGVGNYELVSPDYDYTGSPNIMLMPGTVTVTDWS